MRGPHAHEQLHEHLHRVPKVHLLAVKVLELAVTVHLLAVTEHLVVVEVRRLEHVHVQPVEHDQLQDQPRGRQHGLQIGRQIALQRGLHHDQRHGQKLSRNLVYEVGLFLCLHFRFRRS